MVPGITKIALCLRDQHVFIWQSLEILKVFNTLTLKEISLKMKALRLKTQHFYRKLPCQKPMLKQIERGVQNGTIAKNGVLPITTLFFWKFCFDWRTSYKELIWFKNYPNVHIDTFRKRWNFIWGCFSVWVSLTTPSMPISLNQCRGEIGSFYNWLTSQVTLFLYFFT